MNAHEHTDPHGDGLTITHEDGRVWITCTSKHTEVTVGPLPADILNAHDADGGGAAALVEQEAEQPLTFADRLGEASINAHQAREAEKDAKHLRERCADFEHRLNLAVTACEHNAERAEKAEQERDEAVARADAAESRPLSPEDITDEMVERARSAWLEFARTDGIPTPEVTREMLAAALTEPPTRPEGAEEIERLIETSPWHLAGSCSAEADWLAERGVRVTGAES